MMLPWPGLPTVFLGLLVVEDVGVGAFDFGAMGSSSEKDSQTASPFVTDNCY